MAITIVDDDPSLVGGTLVIQYNSLVSVLKKSAISGDVVGIETITLIV